MSDNVAPAPGASAPATAPTNTPTNTPPNTPPNTRDVPISPAPHQPAPIGPQSAPKPVGDLEGGKGRPESRREGIQRAIDAVRAKQPAPPAEPAKGHNKPPEDTPDEKFSLKRRPTDQPRENGRFVSRAASESRAPDAEAGQAAPLPGAQPAPVYTPPPPGSPPHHTPPARMSDRAKADWAKTPDSVRADGYRIYNEMARAVHAYKGDHDTMNTIRQYDQMARQQGTSLSRVLANHVAIEERLRTDPIAAFEILTHNLNLRTPEGQQLTFRDLAWHHLNQTPEQQQLIQARNTFMAQQAQIAQQQAQIQALVNEQRRMQYAQHFQMTRGAVDRYADTHPRFDELGDLIHAEIGLGFDLDTAYRRANALRPPTAAQTRAPATAAQTRTHDRSISGAPGGSPNGAARQNKAPVTSRDAIANAIRHVRGGL